MKKITNLLCVGASVLVLAACSTGPSQTGYDTISDPMEGVNRKVFAFNKAVDSAVIHPIAKGYRAVVPSPARTGVSNFLRNLKSPTRMANQVLQGDIQGAAAEFSRAAINTTIGIGGLIDVAKETGLEHEPEDFGQTLGVWGVGHGPYMVAPIFGPSSMRDFAGYAVDAYADPLRIYLDNVDKSDVFFVKSGVEYLAMREQLMDLLESLEASSIDYYAAVRSTYYQRRNAMVNDSGSVDGRSGGLVDFDEEY